MLAGGGRGRIEVLIMTAVPRAFLLLAEFHDGFQELCIYHDVGGSVESWAGY